MANLTFSMENYLEAVYELSRTGAGARVSDIAARLDVSKASVNSAMNALHEKGLVTNEKYREVYLTETGLKIAKETAEKHHVLQTLLSQVMGVEEDQAFQDACAMEHVISAQSIGKIKSFLESQGVALV